MACQLFADVTDTIYLQIQLLEEKQRHAGEPIIIVFRINTPMALQVYRYRDRVQPRQLEHHGRKHSWCPNFILLHSRCLKVRSTQLVGDITPCPYRQWLSHTLCLACAISQRVLGCDSRADTNEGSSSKCPISAMLMRCTQMTPGRLSMYKQNASCTTASYHASSTPLSVSSHIA